MMKILDIYKNPLYTLYQWDVNQFVNVVGINPEMPVSVQFWRAGQSEAFVVESTVSGNTVTAAIPNELLREPGELVIYIWQDTGTGEQKGGRTETYFNIPIKERAQPSDYIYDDNVEYISVKTVIEDAKNATTAAQEATEAATTAAKLATDTAEDIKQKADSGEFDGKDGTDGKDGAPGAQGEPGQPGADGKSATITIGTVTTVSPNTPASVTNTGTSTDAIFNFEIPKGQDGSGGGADIETLEKIAIKTTIEGNPAMSGSSADWRIPLIEGYGKSTQGAEPTPEAPQEIKSSVVTGVKVTGRNIFDYTDMLNEDGVIQSNYAKAKDIKPFFVEKGKKYLVISQGTQSENNYSRCYFGEDNLKYLQNDTYVLSVGGGSATVETEWLFSQDAERRYVISPTKTCLITKCIAHSNNLTNKFFVKKFGVFPINNDSEKDLIQYEPYKEQSITLSAPITLRGIPSESGNVTIDGKKYLSDVIDKEKVTRRIGYIASYSGEDVGDLWISTTGQLTTGATVIYALSEPTTETLPPEDVQALADLKTFYPTSIISWETEDGVGAWTRAEIVHDPANYIEEKISSAVTQAITLAQGGTI